MSETVALEQAAIPPGLKELWERKLDALRKEHGYAGSPIWSIVDSSRGNPSELRIRFNALDCSTFAQAILKQLQTTESYVSPAELAILHAAIGEREHAFASLERAYAARDLQLQFLGVDPVRLGRSVSVNPPHNFPTNSRDLISTASAFQAEGRLEQDG